MIASGCFAALMRHGTFIQGEAVPSAHLPHGLTDEGHVEAEQGAAALWALIEKHDMKIDPVIDCSRMRRAWETANIAARVLEERSGQKFSVVEFEQLAERSLGAVANLSEAEIERIVADDPRFAPLPQGWKRIRELKLPFQGAESLSEAGRRVAAHLTQRTTGLATGTLKLFVGHGGAFRNAACELGVLTVPEVERYSMYCGQAVTLVREEQGWRHFAGDWKLRKSVRKSAAPEMGAGA